MPDLWIRAPCLHVGAAVLEASTAGVGGDKGGGVVFVVVVGVDKGIAVYATPTSFAVDAIWVA